MRVLMLATMAPYPPVFGGASRVWNILRQVARRHEVALLAMHTPDAEPLAEAVRVMREHAADVRFVARPTGLARRVASGLRSLGPGPAYTLGNFRFAAFETALRRFVADWNPDLVHAHFLHTAQYHDAFGPAARLFDCHNINTALWRRYAETRTDPLRRVFAMRQAALLARFEPAIHRAFDAVTFCSEDDRRWAVERSPDASLHVSPNGVDCAYFAPRDEPEEPHSLLFCASMATVQNVDAAVWFVGEVLPRIRTRYPDAKAWLVGREPVARVRALASDHVTVTGTVDDVRPYMARAQVHVVPIRVGGGTRLKILEAMAMKRPVVSTTVGAEGIGATDGEHLVLADDADAFAGAVGRLFDDPALRKRLASTGHAFATQRFDWDRIGVRVDEAYAAAMDRARRRAR